MTDVVGFSLKHNIKCPCGETYECSVAGAQFPVDRKALDRLSVGVIVHPVKMGWDMDGGWTCPSCSDLMPALRQMELYYRLRRNGFRAAAIASYFGVSRHTVYMQATAWGKKIKGEDHE